MQRWGKEWLVNDRNNRAIPDNFIRAAEVIFKSYTNVYFDSQLVSCSCSLQVLKSWLFCRIHVRALLEVGEQLKCCRTVNQAGDEI